MMKDYFEKYDEEKLLNNLKHADGKVYFRGTLADLSNCTFSKILEKAERARINRIARAKATEQNERLFAKFDFIENHKNKAKELESAFSEFYEKQERENAPKRFMPVEPCKYNFDSKSIKGSFNLVSYGDSVLDELVKAVLFAFLGQRVAQPEKATFWNLQAYELITANKKGEICGTFVSDAYVKFMEFDEKERTANLQKYARKAANNAIYQYKYKGDGKSLAGKESDIVENAHADNTIIRLTNSLHYAEKLKKAFLKKRLADLTLKQRQAICIYLENVTLYNSEKDVFEFGTYRNKPVSEFFKNYDSYKRTFYNARKALKIDIFSEKWNGYIDTLCNMLYENKTYNAEILFAKYEKQRAESEKRELIRIASAPATKWHKP